MKKEKSIRGKVVACAFVLSILVLVFAGIMPVAASMTWYVDDSGGADFTSIQWAVDNASAGDTIIVRDGTYIENVDVNEQLTLIGGKRKTQTTMFLRYRPTQMFQDSQQQERLELAKQDLGFADGHPTSIFHTTQYQATITASICTAQVFL
jgi:hypothetical protein